MRSPKPHNESKDNDLFELEGCPGEPLIEMIDIVKTFKTPAGDFSALKGISACFYPGEFVSVVGRSGSGKSTLVNMITGIDHPTSGIVRIGKTYVHEKSESQMSVWRGRNLGIVFQFFQLLPMLSLLENVMLPMDFCDKYEPAERERRAMELLELVGLQDLAHKMPAAVSGGQQQSAAIARALANDPPILIADEPTGNLDSRTADSVFQIFTELEGQGKTILMVTHDSSLARRTRRTLLLSDGELINEWVARAFPQFPHPRLLWLTHQVATMQFEPGEAVPLEGLILVTSGCLEVVANKRHDPEVAALHLEPGEYFSVLDWQAAGSTLSSLRAVGDSPLEVLALEQDAFDQWMHEASSERASLQGMAGERAARISAGREFRERQAP